MSDELPGEDDLPREPGWHTDPEGRRRWWTGSVWGAYAAWGDATDDSPAPTGRPARPRLDASLTFDPTAEGRIARAEGQPEPAQGQVTPSLLRSSGGAVGAASHATGAPGDKRAGTAFALLLVTGLLGGHRYYLGRLGSGIVQMMLSFAGAGSAVVAQGGGPAWLWAVPAAAAIWWLTDLVRVRAMVREHHRGSARRSDAPGYDRGWPDP